MSIYVITNLCVYAIDQNGDIQRKRSCLGRHFIHVQFYQQCTIDALILYIFHFFEVW